MKPYITIIKLETSDKKATMWILWNKYNTQLQAIEGKKELLKHKNILDVKIFNRLRKQKDIEKLIMKSEKETDIKEVIKKWELILKQDKDKNIVYRRKVIEEILADIKKSEYFDRKLSQSDQIKDIQNEENE